MDIKERNYKEMKSAFETEGLNQGPWTSWSMMHDARHMAFVLSRYKFVAKMLEGRKRVMEVGSGDAFGLPIVAQNLCEGGVLYAVDWESEFLDDNRKRLPFLNNVKFIHHDMNEKALKDVNVSAIYLIDVIEHVDPVKEDVFMRNMVASYENKEDAVMIIGTPNQTAAEYASVQSKAVHINLKGQDSLKALLRKYFHNTFLFGMNDEVVHTGFAPMCHYIWGIGAGLKEQQPLTGE